MAEEASRKLRADTKILANESDQKVRFHIGPRKLLTKILIYGVAPPFLHF